MRDLTRGPMTRHVLAMAAPIAVGMFVQTMHYLVDLYFVSKLGDTALAGVSVTPASEWPTNTNSLRSRGSISATR